MIRARETCSFTFGFRQGVTFAKVRQIRVRVQHPHVLDVLGCPFDPAVFHKRGAGDPRPGGKDGMIRATRPSNTCATPISRQIPTVLFVNPLQETEALLTMTKDRAACRDR